MPRKHSTQHPLARGLDIFRGNKPEGQDHVPFNFAGKYCNYLQLSVDSGYHWVLGIRVACGGARPR